MSEVPVASPIPARIPVELIDPEALKVLARLHRSGFEGYLVGGCVRDLLLGRRPKDFDVSTSAHPHEVRAVFRNCRLIGRRFRLAHVYFKGGKIIEVSTFRANPLDAIEDLPEGDRLIRQDNVFGNAEEDARRRDFTVNGLFYDVHEERVIDYVGGLQDLAARLMRTIGDPMLRLAEDPVRILRAVRFAAKLGFGVDAGTYAAMKRYAVEMPRCAPPRVLEEVLKLLRSGASMRCFQLLNEVHGLDVLLPAVAEHLDRVGPDGVARMQSTLSALDARVAEGPLPDDAVLLAALIWDLPREGQEPRVEGAHAELVLEEMVRDSRLPRRIAERARLIMNAVPVMTGQSKRRRKWSAMGFARTHYFADALELLAIVVRATGQDADALERWRSRGRGEPVTEEPPPPEGFAEELPGKKRKRRRRRRRRGGAPTASPAS